MCSTNILFVISCHLILGLNPKLPDFMLPKKKKSGATVKPAVESSLTGSPEPTAGTSTGGHTTQVDLNCNTIISC